MVRMMSWMMTKNDKTTDTVTDEHTHSNAVELYYVVLDDPTGFLIEWENKNHNIKDDINENYDIDSISN